MNVIDVLLDSHMIHEAPAFVLALSGVAGTGDLDCRSRCIGIALFQILRNGSSCVTSHFCADDD